MPVNQEIFWTEYTDFDNSISSFDGENVYVKAKTSKMVTVICGIKNIHLLAPRFLFFLM